MMGFKEYIFKINLKDKKIANFIFYLKNLR